MNTREAFNFTPADGVPPSVAPFSHAVRWGDLLFVTGQMPTVPETGELVSGDVVEQTRQVLKNLSAVLNQFGACLDDVLMTRVFLVNFADFSKVNEEYVRWFHKPLPGRTCIGVTGLAAGASIEIDFVVGLKK